MTEAVGEFNLKAQMMSDRIAVGLSFACVIHCFFAPSLIILSYSFLSLSVDSELIHYLILFTAFPVSMFALISGYKKTETLGILVRGRVALLNSFWITLWESDKKEECKSFLLGLVTVHIGFCPLLYGGNLHKFQSAQT